MATIRVTAAQFEAGDNPDRNLEELLALAERAAEVNADLVHFPEFCNHPVWYDSQDHAWQAATALDDGFVGAIASFARRNSLYVSFNSTARGGYPTVFGQSHLIGRDGSLLVAAHKQILMYKEKDFLTPAAAQSMVVELEFGRVGLMACMDGLVPETVRCLVVDGAELILNSLASNGFDEADTHIPVRAAENGVFVVSANRVGPAVGESALPALEALTGMKPEQLFGAGESQIVGPDGSVLARASKGGTDVVFADIDLGQSLRARRLAGRRPGLYEELTTPPAGLGPVAERPAGMLSIATAGVAGSGVDAAVAACKSLDAELIVLPELSGLARPEGLDDCDRLAKESEELIAAIRVICRERNSWVVAGAVCREAASYFNCAVLVGPDGVAAEYRQTHVHPEDGGWATAGESFVTYDLPVGRLGLLVGFDLSIPEAARIVALRGADVIACPTTWREDWEVDLGCLERSAENHVSLACAARADSPANRPGLIVTPCRDYVRPDTQEVNPVMSFTAPDLVSSVSEVVDLRRSRDKRLLGRTDLIADARPDLYGALIRRDWPGAGPSGARWERVAIGTDSEGAGS